MTLNDTNNILQTQLRQERERKDWDVCDNCLEEFPKSELKLVKERGGKYLLCEGCR